MECFDAVCEYLCKLHAEKDKRYSNAFGDVRRKYPETIAVMLEFKLKRLETLLANNELENEESIVDTLLDMAAYAIMEVVEREIDYETL